MLPNKMLLIGICVGIAVLIILIIAIIIVAVSLNKKKKNTNQYQTGNAGHSAPLPGNVTPQMEFVQRPGAAMAPAEPLPQTPSTIEPPIREEKTLVPPVVNILADAPEKVDEASADACTPDEREDDNMTRRPVFMDDIDRYTVTTASGSTLRIGKIHAVGRRKNQQDSFAYYDVQNLEQMEQKGVLLLVADGMGGLSHGAEVSALVATEMLRYFDEHELTADIPGQLREMLYHANDKVSDFLGADGLGQSGSTLVAAHIKDHQIYWISVGDSCIYLCRDNQLYRLNELHNYGTQLDKQVARGELSPEEAKSKKNRAALTSFIGAGEIALIDQNTEPLTILPGDRFILMSDGIETVSEDELKQMLCYDVEEAALKLRYLIESKDKRNQDNFTAIILEDNY